MHEPNESPHDPIKGKILYFLGIALLLQFGYPFTDGNKIWTLIIYQICYFSLIGVGIFFAQDMPHLRNLLIILGLSFFSAALVYDFYQDVKIALFITYITIALFQTLVVQILLRFIFRATVVDTDIIYAASTVYLLLGAIFVPIYGIIETLNPGSFVDNSVQADVFPWQHFVYYSYATLTTLGYGDILPVTMLARSAASLQAVIGVLYMTIVMARLVGLYASSQED